ncbi:hypothetical protein J6590_074560 [Homalodisca vitripennis]|nr:hypothetical protein J6590_074560 [Homalodisca vitripennis]
MQKANPQTMQLTRLLEKGCRWIGEGRTHAQTILDQTKAIDCVHQLELCDIQGLPHKWISSYFKGRYQCVQISSVIELAYGIPIFQ